MNADAERLHRYVTEGSETAFHELVRRHVNLVYSAALRLVNRDVHRAEDITQQVFTELARQSKRLISHPALVGWLYTTTRRMALRAIRTEQRRAAREHEACLMNELLLAPAVEPDWDHLHPLLEEAMHTLNEKDRVAILLRFFENKSLNEVGLALGLRESAARMRIERALDRLRLKLACKGIGYSSAALAVTLSQNAVSAAPAAFVSTLTTTSLASAAAGSATTFNFLELIAMTKSQLAVIGTVLVASVVTPLVVQDRAQAKLHEQDERFRQQEAQRATWESENQRLSNLLAQAGQSVLPSNAELLRLRGEVARLRKDVQELAQPKPAAPRSRTDQLTAIAQRYAERINRLKQHLQASPSESIPELQFMTDKDWLLLAGEKMPETPEGYQRAMSFARLTVESNLAREVMRPALQQFASDHNGQFPTDLSQLKPYFKTPLDDTILQRWHILHASRLPNLRRNLEKEDWVITQKAPVNAAFDQRVVFSEKHSHLFSGAPPNQWETSP